MEYNKLFNFNTILVITIYNLSSSLICHSLSSEPIVLTNNGLIKGSTAKDFFGNDYYYFLGIPYAEKPIQQLRFKAPKPVKNWSLLYNATYFRDICTQYNLDTEEVDGSEDCLYLNIYTKSIHSDNKQLKPVMFYIHGGTFRFGSPRTSSPDFLITENIVLVTIQYRLDFLGFASIDDERADIPGNAGFKDQVMALKWVKNNIEKFGGNPKQITIFGHSSGSMSVHALILSPLAAGLFQKAIAQSGVAPIRRVDPRTLYHKVAEKVSCNYTDIHQMVQCFRETSAEKLILALKDIRPEVVKYTEYDSSGLAIEYPNNNAFLTKPIITILKSKDFNQVPTIFGFCTDDGTSAVTTPGLGIPINETDYQRFVPNRFHYKYNSTERIQLGDKIKQFYYGSETPSINTLREYVNYETDAIYVYDIYKFARYHVKYSKSPVYFYNFDYFTGLNKQIPHLSGKLVPHGTENEYLFVPRTKSLTENELIAVYRTVKLWTTFAHSKIGDPNPVNDSKVSTKWESVQLSAFNYLQINEEFQMKTNPEKEQMAFWESIDTDPNVIGVYSEK